MWILMVEAGVALFLLVFIVWWTMFAGRKDLERDDVPQPQDDRDDRGGRDDRDDAMPR